VPRRSLSGLALGGLLLGFGLLYAWRTLWVVWPYLSRVGGDFTYYFEASSQLAAGRSPFLHHFDYPPLMAFLTWSLVGLGFDGARLAWYLASQAALLAAAGLLFRPLGGDRSAALGIAAVWALGGTVQENLVLGQVQPLLLFLIALAWHWQARRPALAAGALGVAAAVKLWPGLLLAAFLPRRAYRAVVAGLLVAGLGVAVPSALLAAFWPAPHRPSGAFWMGTPASLNFSLPALALKAADRPVDLAAPPPPRWQAGHVHSTFRLSVEQRRLSLGVCALVLAAGLAVLAAAVGWRGRPIPAARGLWLLAALTALATLAAPISWYHYQLFQFPGLALLAATALRRRRWGALAGLALLTAALTGLGVRELFWGSGSAGVILAVHGTVVAANLALWLWLVREMILAGRSGEELPEAAR
jgi:hypothetical protein